MNDPQIDRIDPLVEGEDYYLEDGLFVFTSAYHLKRGYCCHSGCRHCPFGDTTHGNDQTAEIEKSPVRHSSCSADKMSDE